MRACVRVCVLCMARLDLISDAIDCGGLSFELNNLQFENAYFSNNSIYILTYCRFPINVVLPSTSIQCIDIYSICIDICIIILLVCI